MRTSSAHAGEGIVILGARHQRGTSARAERTRCGRQAPPQVTPLARSIPAGAGPTCSRRPRHVECVAILEPAAMGSRPAVLRVRIMCGVGITGDILTPEWRSI